MHKKRAALQWARDLSGSRSEDQRAVTTATSFEAWGEASDSDIGPAKPTDHNRISQTIRPYLDLAGFARPACPRDRGATGSEIGIARGAFVVPDTIDAANDEVDRLFHGSSVRLPTSPSGNPGFPHLPPTSSPIRATQSSSVAASVWEIAIKHALARGLASDMPVSGPDALGFFRAAGYELLAVTADHAAAVATLPPLHRDPFDRIIVAQALHEPLRLMVPRPHGQSLQRRLSGRTLVGFDRFIGFVHAPLINHKRLVCRISRSHPVHPVVPINTTT